MPRYFVDFNDGQAETCDNTGTDMPSPEAARDDVMRMLVDTARFEIARSGSGQLLVATVRDGAGQDLYRVMLALTCSRLGEEAPRLRRCNAEPAV